MIKNLIFGIILLKILFLAYNFFISVQVFFFISNFPEESPKPTNTIDKDHLFCDTFVLKTPHSFYEP